MFKEPDFHDPIGRYLFDKWYWDFWENRTWLGRIVLAPVGLPAFVLVLIIWVVGSVWVKTQKEG